MQVKRQKPRDLFISIHERELILLWLLSEQAFRKFYYAPLHDGICILDLSAQTASVELKTLSESKHFNIRKRFMKVLLHSHRNGFFFFLFPHFINHAKFSSFFETNSLWICFHIGIVGEVELGAERRLLEQAWWIQMNCDWISIRSKFE